MNDGQLETKLDLTAETEQKLAQAKTLAASPSGLGPAIDLLLSAEKATRVGNDLESLKLVVTACVDLCKAANDYEKLLETINFIAKRRSQKNGAIQAVVKGGMDCLEGSPDEATKEKLVRCLRDITDGKIYVEGERASLTMTLALMLEKQDKINEAATVVQEVHVETYGSLSKKEKVEFILEQVRLVLRKKDFVRAYIVSQKINRKVFQDESFAELKIRFFDLMAGYFREQKDAFSLCDCYHQMYNTTSVKENDEECRNMLERTVTFAVLSPYSNEQQDLLHRLNAIDTELADAEHLKEVLKLFTTNELIAYPFAQQQRLLGIDAVTAWGEDLAAHWGVIMHTRVVEHNVRVAAKYYSRIAGKRLSALLGLSYDDLEAHISNMVSSGDIYAKIDRPRDVIVFKRALGQDEILNDWKGDINELLNLVEDTTHEINKEMMAV